MEHRAWLVLPPSPMKTYVCPGGALGETQNFATTSFNAKKVLSAFLKTTFEPNEA